MRLPILYPIFAPLYLAAAVIDLAVNGNKPVLTRAIQNAVDRDQETKGPRPSAETTR